MSVPVSLYLPPRVHLAGARCDPLLLDLGAPIDGGIFEAADRYLARQAITAHKVALVDPVDAECTMMLWWCMQRSREAPAVYVGPQLYFDPAAYRAPVLPRGGVTARQALAAYLASAPVPLALPAGRLSVRRYSQPPAVLWRRTVPTPALNCARHPPEHFELWQRFEMQLRALPGPRYLANWYRRVRSQWWARFAVARFLADAASAAIVAYRPDGADAPVTFWSESDIDFDAERGALFCRSDSRVPLLASLRFHRADNPPPAAIELREVRHIRGLAGRDASAESRTRSKRAAQPHAVVA